MNSALSSVYELAALQIAHVYSQKKRFQNTKNQHIALFIEKLFCHDSAHKLGLF